MLLPVQEQDKRPSQSIGSTPQKQDALCFEQLQDNYDNFVTDMNLMSLMQFCVKELGSESLLPNFLCTMSTVACYFKIMAD
jgi:hypothetical protein